MDTAMMLHFNVLTPSHHEGGVSSWGRGSGRALPPRPAKRGGSPTASTGPAGSADWCVSLPTSVLNSELVKETPLYKPTERGGSPAPSTGPAGSADWCAVC